MGVISGRSIKGGIMNKACRNCRHKEDLRDTDLAPIHRTQANFWRRLWLELHIELQKANKGLKRLSNYKKRVKGEGEWKER